MRGAEKFLHLKNVSWDCINNKGSREDPVIRQIIIAQWNERSIIANGQEFKGFKGGKTDIKCIEEIWLKPTLDCYKRL